MDVIIGLGGAACSVVREFEKYPQYDIYKLDDECSQEENYYELEKHDNTEDYEAKCPDLTHFFKDLGGEVLFVVCGASTVSAASLAILQQIHRKAEINVLYLKPDTFLLNELRKLQERTVYNVLQQYARSGLLKQTFLFENAALEEIVGDVPIAELRKKVNELIVHTIHMMNIFHHTQPLTKTFSTPHPSARICTLGALDISTEEEKNYFDLKNTREKEYYFAISEGALKTDTKLNKKILDLVKDQKSDDLFVSYGIYSTKYDRSFAYSVSRSSFVQQG